MARKSAAALVAVLLLQQQHPLESIQIVTICACTKFGVDEWITTQIIQFADFTSFSFEKRPPAAAAVL